MKLHARWITVAAAPIAALWAPTRALGHPGHHEGGAGGLLHAVTEPDHLLALLLIGAAVVWAPRLLRYSMEMLRRRRGRKENAQRTTDSNSLST